MVEPPVVGFTGVIWQARPTDQLARDLTTGRGATPMAEAGAAWAKLAASFGAAVVEYDQIVSKIRESWRSAESEVVIERITTLRDWLADAAVAAGQNAGRAGGQAVAHEVARLAMPHVAEIAALETARQGIEQAGAALGAPLVAAAAEVDTQQDLAKSNAARVMQSYESATTPLATPWQHQQPPVIASSAALEAEQAGPTRTTSAPGPGVMAAGFVPHVGAIAMPREKTAYRAQSVAKSVSAPEVVPVESTPVSADNNAASRIAPGGMAPGAVMGEAERTVRAGAIAARPGEGLEIEAGVDVAPPVLGAAVEQAPRPTSQTEVAS
ncbi:PPE domain-containing protein [Nocardia sp. GCM10030253]|uniref:PPE domain-containing protein n=1 Tax=Nocardia sp. GCM10030253 TaxID=3273404 RepID=UPI003645B065